MKTLPSTPEQAASKVPPELSYNDAIVVLRDILDNLDMNRLREALSVIIKTKGYDLLLPGFADVFGLMSDGRHDERGEG